MSEKIYLSGYTKKGNKGIHSITLNDDYSIVESKLIVEEMNPSYIAFNRDKSLLFSISSMDNGSVSMYRLNNGEYEFQDRAGGLVSAPCHLYYDEVRNLLFASNYHEGRVDIFKVGEFDDLEQLEPIEIAGRSIMPVQDRSRCHMAIEDPRHRHLFVVNLGCDTLYSYDINEYGNFRLIDTYHAKPGSGPRHLIFGKDGIHAYLLSELTSEIDILEYDRHNAEFKHIDFVSTLPEGYVEENAAAAIKESSDGKFIYTSNRGHDSIAVFKIEGEKLTLIQVIKTGGKTPRDFELNHDEKLIIVGHQNSEKVVFFRRDIETGLLEKCDYMELDIPEITCVVK